MAEIYILCGTVGTGKSTYARKLEKEGSAILFSVDEWMIHFYGDDLPRPEFEEKLDVCKEMIYRVCEKLLKNNRNVVLDFGFWKRSERDYVRNRFKDHKVNLIFFDIPYDVIRTRLKNRNNNLSEYSYEITDEMFSLFTGWFERPGMDEDPLIITG